MYFRISRELWNTDRTTNVQKENIIAEYDKNIAWMLSTEFGIWQKLLS